MKKMKIKSVLIGLALSLAPLHVQAAKTEIPQAVIDLYEAHTIEDMGYRLLRPVNFDPNVNYPVVITLHNGPAMSEIGTKSYNVKNLRFMNVQFADPARRLEYPAYILCPQTSSPFSKKHLGLCKQIIAGLPSVDMGRIYVMGQSMGGGGTYTFIAADPAYFAAAIACSGNGGRVEAPAVLKNFNLWALHGADDTTVPYDKDLAFFEEMKKINGRMKFTTFIKIGHSTEALMIGNYSMTDTPQPSGSLRNGQTTQAAGPGFDPEPDTLKWLFSKRSGK